MHNYNPPHKYSLRTRMGNWSEEWDLEETKYRCADLDARSTSEGNTREYLMSMKSSTSSPGATRAYPIPLTQASLTHSKDNFRKFGDHVMFFNGKV